MEDRSVFRSNGIPMVGWRMIMQSTANVIELSEAVQVELNAYKVPA
ncbi:hypothetical protein [Halomonas sp. PA16-9]